MNATSERDIAAAVNAFRRILRALRVIARKSELATGLSPAQLFVLSVVADKPAASVNDIAAATMTDRSSVAAVVDRLVDNGFAIRSTSKEDRRRADIRITALGRRAMQRAAPPPTAMLLHAMRSLTAGEIHGLATGLVALTGSLGIADEPAGMLFDDAPRENKKAAKASRKRASR